MSIILSIIMTALQVLFFISYFIIVAAAIKYLRSK